MTAVRRADPAARRHAVLILLVGTCVGALLILGFERYHTPLRDWMLAEPEASGAASQVGFSTSGRAPTSALACVHGLSLVPRRKGSSGARISTPGISCHSRYSGYDRREGDVPRASAQSARAWLRYRFCCVRSSTLVACVIVKWPCGLTARSTVGSRSLSILFSPLAGAKTASP
jgi:hypothetical protein